MSSFAQGDIAVLLFLLGSALCIVVDRSVHFLRARWESQTFLGTAAVSMRAGRDEDVLPHALRREKSHVARVVAAGIIAINEDLGEATKQEAIELVRNSLRRAVNTAHSELSRNLASLAAISSTAPFVGLFGTCTGILDAFRGIGMSHATALAFVAAAIAEALVTTALGLLVAVPSVWAYNYFSDQLEMFDAEMKSASAEMMTYAQCRLAARATANSR